MPGAEFQLDATQLKALIVKLSTASRGEAMTRSMDQSGLYLTGWIKKFRLTGPRPRNLGVVTGRLRSSLSSSRAEKTSTGYTTRIGTNVKYAEVHEFGFRGVVRVRGFTRRRKGISEFVSAHSRRMDVPARPFMRPALSDRTNQMKILDIFTVNINKVLEKK